MFFTGRLSFRTSRKIRFSGNEVASKPLWTLCPSSCHTGPDVPQPEHPKASTKNLVYPAKKTTGRQCEMHYKVSQAQGTSTRILNQVTKTSKSQRFVCQPVLDHFDQQYSEELGDLWRSARAVLLEPHSWQYGVLLNRFTVVTDIKQTLHSQGFSTLLPHTDASPLTCDVPAVSGAKSQRGVPLSPPSNVKCPSDDSHVASQQLPSEPQCRLPTSLLQCYIHPHPLRFPSQAHRPGQLKQYYLLNAASLLPVLALQIKDGEKVLDLCSAPGGKALAILQCATPAFLCCNEPDPHRRSWLAKTLESYLPHALNSRVIVSAQDGRSFGRTEAGTYDKVLVDAPCSNDRSWLYSSGVQQGEQRLNGRAALPHLQAQLLRSALSAVRPGGVVVYSTCTLSGAENYSVVESVLDSCPEAEAEDLWEEIAVPLSNYFAFGAARPHGRSPPPPQRGAVPPRQHRLGILVVPQPGRTWGPMFLSRIRRKK